MGHFSQEIWLGPLSDGDHWKVRDPFSYCTDAGEMIEVPGGFVTDLASVPRIFWNILPPFGKYDGAAIVHDLLYGRQTRKRSQCDAILLEAMKAEEVSWLQRWTIYLAVRAGGWKAWNQHTAENKLRGETANVQ